MYRRILRSQATRGLVIAIEHLPQASVRLPATFIPAFMIPAPVDSGHDGSK